MRLLKREKGRLILTHHPAGDIPPYAILSHTWGRDGEEVTYDDIVHGTGETKTGYRKILYCEEQAKLDELQYFWIDTCCIDKSNSAELTEAINSMFKWYKNSVQCYAYLSDVFMTVPENANQSTVLMEQAFRESRWFTRGWTLQELLAPKSVQFFTAEWKALGDKVLLAQEIHRITSIPLEALLEYNAVEFDIEERFSWASDRQTTREEDLAYCLLGIFDVFIGPIYGEGKANALRRLRREIEDAQCHGHGRPPQLSSASSSAAIATIQHILVLIDKGIELVELSIYTETLDESFLLLRSFLIIEIQGRSESLANVASCLEAAPRRELQSLIENISRASKKLLVFFSPYAQNGSVSETEKSDEAKDETHDESLTDLHYEYFSLKIMVMGMNLVAIWSPSTKKAPPRSSSQQSLNDELEMNRNLIKWNGSSLLTAEELYHLSQQATSTIDRLNVDFEFRDEKFDHIDDAAIDTFNWMTRFDQSDTMFIESIVKEHEGDVVTHYAKEAREKQAGAAKQFRSFLQDERIACIILGKPGSGKSTLLKSLAESSATRRELNAWAQGQGKILIQAHFFFSVNFGHGGLVTQEAMYRHLLIQILRSHPELVSILVEGELSLNTSTKISDKAIKRAVTSLFHGRNEIASKYCVSLVIDGLDEFRRTSNQAQQINDQIFELISDLLDLARARTATKLILSSRPVEKLIPEDDGRDLMILRLHEYTKLDIHQFSFSRLNASVLTSRNLNIENAEELSEKIAERAEGVFLWAKLMTEDVVAARIRGDNYEKLQQRVEDSSQNLNDVYKDILNRTERSNRDQALLLLYLAAFKDPEFRLNAMACSWLQDLERPGFPLDVAAGEYSGEETERRLESSKLATEALTHGLLTVSKFPDTYNRIPFFSTEIVFFHRSIQDFVRQLLEGSLEDWETNDGHDKSWLYGSKTKIEEKLGIHDGPLQVLNRILLAEIRFGVPRPEEEEYAQDDMLDLGIWSSHPTQTQKAFLSQASYDDDYFSRLLGVHFRGENRSHKMSRFRVNASYSLFGNECRSKKRRHGTIRWDMYNDLDISRYLAGKQVGKTTSAQLAALGSFTPSTAKTNTVSWLLKTKRTSPSEKLFVWPIETVRKETDSLPLRWKNKSVTTLRVLSRGPIREFHGCWSCSDAEGIVDKPRKSVSIWVLVLFVYACEHTFSEHHIPLLEVWLRQSNPADAIIIIAATHRDSAGMLDFDKHLYYLEIEQISQYERDAQGLASLGSLESALRSWRRRRQAWSWLAWPFRLLWWLVRALSRRPVELARDIRKGYRHLSNEELDEMKWLVYGVVSTDDELLGSFEYWLY